MLQGFFIGFGIPFGMAAGILAVIALWHVAEKIFDRKA